MLCYCLTVTKSARVEDCEQVNGTLLAAPSGVISSRLSPVGSRCPWVIRVLPYQHINITLVDFHASQSTLASLLFILLSNL